MFQAYVSVFLLILIIVKFYIIIAYLTLFYVGKQFKICYINFRILYVQ